MSLEITSVLNNNRKKGWINFKITLFIFLQACLLISGYWNKFNFNINDKI